jgi:hypothetical protein
MAILKQIVCRSHDRDPAVSFAMDENIAWCILLDML